MRCREKFAGERCRLSGEHDVHASRNGRVVWGVERADLLDGITTDKDDGGDEDEDDDQVVVIDSAKQYEEPFAHVLVEKRIVWKSCRSCQGTGVAYDPLTGEGPKCPPCLRRELPT